MKVIFLKSMFHPFKLSILGENLPVFIFQPDILLSHIKSHWLHLCYYLVRKVSTESIFRLLCGCQDCKFFLKKGEKEIKRNFRRFNIPEWL